MKKRVLSMILTLILCFSTLPMTALAQEADVVAEQEEQQEADSAKGQEEQQEAVPAGEASDTVKPTVDSVSDSDAGTQDTSADDEKKAAVQKVQALIDALPETVTVENAESVSAQLEAIDEAMESLTEEQIAELDMTRLHAISEAMNAPMTVAEGEHTHCICGMNHQGVGDHTADSQVTFKKLWMDKGILKIDDAEVEKKSGIAGYSGECYVLPSGNYYLDSDLTLSCPIYIGQESNSDTEAKDVNLCLNGKSITANGDFDTIILFCNNSNAKMALSLTDCQGNGKITHADGKNGCGVYVDAFHRATFNMYRGSITGNNGHASSSNTSTPNGGGVYMNNPTDGDNYGGIFNMYDGTISKNSATTGGGLFMCNNGGNIFNMYGGSITGNTATSKGGGVYSDGGKITMTGGSIENNNAPQGGGMYASGGSAAMSGGSITRNTATGKGGGVYVSEGGSLRISGSVQITGNTKESAVNNVELAAGKTITIQSGLAEGASIGVTTEKTPGTGDYSKVASGAEGYFLTGADANRFFSDVNKTTYTIKCADNKLILTNTGDSTLHYHPICGETCTHKNADGTFQHKAVYWEATSDLNDKMPAGYYYLTRNVTLTQSWRPAAGMVLDLNGHDIIMNANGYVISRGNEPGAFTLTDCIGGQGRYGKITHGNNYKGGGIKLASPMYYHYTMSFEMYGGSITGNTGSYPGVCLEYNSNRPITFNMYGGEITNNTNQSTTGSYKGGGVYVAAGNTFTMTGGKITGNQTATYGGGVYVDKGTKLGNFIVSGNAQITGNHKGDGSLDNVYLKSDANGTQKQAYIQVKGALSNNASIGVNAGTIDEGSYKIVAQGSKYMLTNDDLNHFNSDVAGYTSQLVDNSIAFTNGTLHEHKICGKTDCNDGHSNVLWIPLTYDATAKTLKYGATEASSTTKTNPTEHYIYTLPAGNYYLAENITLEGSISISGDVNICLDGHTISTNKYCHGVFYFTDYKLTVCDCKNTGKISVINTQERQSAAVNINNSSASFELYGGTISGGSTGVFTNGPVSLYGGTIEGNQQGVYLFRTTLTIGGDAKVTGNTTQNVFLQDTATIIINNSLTEAAQIGITTSNEPTENQRVLFATDATKTDLDYSKIFIPDVKNKNYIVSKGEAGNLYLGIHQHNWQATAEGARITFKCNATGCNLESDFATTYYTVTAPTDLTYSGSEKVATVTKDDKYFDGLGLPPIPAITYQKLKETGYVGIEGAPKDAGTYQASITVDNVTASVTYDIVSKEVPNPTITVAGTYTYDGTKKEPPVVVKDGDMVIPDSEYSVSYANNINVGTATVTITGVAGGNYNVSGRTTFTIGKAIITVTPKTDQKKIYGGEDPILEYNYAGAVAGETPAFTGTLSRAEGTNAGKYDIKLDTLALADNGSFKEANYELKLADTTVQFTIVPKILTAEDLEFITDTPITKQYDGTTECTTAKVKIKDNAKADPNDAVPTVTGTYAYNSANVTEANKVTFTSDMTSNTNYILPKDLKLGHEANITKAPQNALTIIPRSAIYGTDLQLTVNGGSGTGEVTYTVVNVTGAATMIDGILHPVKVGKVTVLAKKSGDDNYYYVQSARTTITIAQGTYPRTVSKTVNLIKGRSDAQTGTLTAADFFPEGAPEGAVISVLSESENMTMLDGGLKLDSTNQLTYTSGTYIVNADDQKCTVTISSDNYHDITATLIFHPTDKETVTISGLTYTGKTYDGKAMKPVGTLQVSGDKVPVSELEVTYTGTGDTTYNSSDAPKDAGTYKVTYKVADSNENYTGEATYSFTISQKAVNTDMIGAIADETYTGSAITPHPIVTDGNTILTSGKDFDFSYGENINASENTATLTITGKGNYTGTANQKFTIKPKDISSATIRLHNNSFIYDGIAKKVEIVSVTLGENTNILTLTSPTDYDIKAGNTFTSANDAITLTIAGRGNYTGTADTTWEITKARPELGNFDVSPNLSTPLTYDGTPKTVTAQPKNGVIGMGEVTVCYEGSNGTTYARSKTAPTNAGTYQVILSVVEGKNYTEEEIAAGTLTIEKADLTVGDVTEFFEYTKTGAQTISLAELVPGATNYAPGTYTDDNGILTGDLTIDATGLMKFTLSALTIGNIDNKVTVPVTITSENYKDVTVNVTIYISPEYRIIDGAGSSWTQNTTGTVVIRGNGEYDRFRAVKVDGKVIAPANYDKKEGSTIITLKAEYLKTLATGSHTFAIVWDNGIAGTSFTVAANTSGNSSGNNSNNNDSNHGSDNSGNNDSGNTAGTAANTAAAPAQELDKVPATGDASGIWLALFAVSLSGWAVMLILKRKPGQKADPK